MKAKLLLLTLLFAISCTFVKAQSTVKKGMIKVTILYPNGEGKTFDMNYYKNSHMPLMRKFFNPKHLAIDQGLKSGMPDQPMPFLAIGYLYFDKLSDYEEALAKHVTEIRADFIKYTNTTPVVQISEVVE
ncbi:uncharacterized protein (TIGR02118 family) [Chitinophaga skermanii]|uniref:Uncharacterized protein (TIGR02118 family) n=1 Tax=Chitinophaga skermanii TaxID=331697 RepID=A0A327QXH7_9BACT|nr:EthD family reductase [Chitinophaga skermanii]RAJ08342.1 uncharacterized protein (TIGR02118 family) [Chitinophaga skermanii]